MLLEINSKKYKETPEGFKKIVGLVGLTAAIIITFFILDIFFGGREKTVESDKTVERDKTAESDKTLISSLPKGRLNFFESSDGHQLSPSEFEAVCKNTKIVTQRAIMGANITNYKAQQLYFDNGNKIDKYSVKWDSSSKKCFAEYTIRALEGTSDTIKVSGEAKGFLKTSIDTRVYFIKNF
jgi:hypothetical protein